MSNVALFVLGVVVTSIVAAAIAPLVWAAVLDGRYDRDQRRLRAVPDEDAPSGPRAA